MNKPLLALLLLPLGLALGSAGTRADQNDPRLDELFQQLQMAGNEVAAFPIEQQIWQIWIEHENAGYYQLMLSGIRYMNQNQAAQALEVFTRLVAQAPDYAEAWNKRATLHYLMGNWAASEADIVETLRLEPFHFGALSGRGLVALGRGDYDAAYRSFQRVLEVYPAMPGIRDTLLQLEQQLGESSI